jgi:hypothetical protein
MSLGVAYIDFVLVFPAAFLKPNRDVMTGLIDHAYSEKYGGTQLDFAAHRIGGN